MPRKKHTKRSGVAKNGGALGDVLSLYAKLADLKKDMTKATEEGAQVEDRLTSMESHMNILVRLLTTLCIEKFGIRLTALKRMVRRVEKEAVRDSQIMELESLYKLSHEAIKKNPPAGIKPKDDPWDQVS